ncbi:MAG: hypothetical protein JXB13_06395, partial [Phycisphaerae bacterium]|nr:hypothetical protein [Phycisphaerae bacterium]
MLTLLNWSNPKSPNHVPPDVAEPFIRKLGVNHVWGWDPSLPCPVHSVHLICQTYKQITVPNEQEWMYVYLRTPWLEKGEAPLTVDMLQGYYSGRFMLPRTVDPALAVKVEEEDAGTFLPPDAYAVNPGKAVLTLSGGTAGKRYRAIFLASDKGFNLIHHKQQLSYPRRRIGDGTVSSVKAHQFNWLKTFLNEHPHADVIRPTSEIFDRFDRMADPVAPHTARLPIYSRNAFWQGMSPARLKRFEQRYGKPFDPRWIVDHGFGEFGFVPEEGYRQWIDLIRGELHVYVRERNNLVHQHGRRVRVFYGDNYVGLVPSLGDIAHCGYDEAVSAMDGGPGSVRTMTEFPEPTRVIVRFPWSGHGTEPAVLRSAFDTRWRWMKRECLFQCPDGFTMGGLGTALTGYPVVAAETERIFDDFRTVYDRTHGQEVFRHKDFNVYVLNAWGNMAAWNTKVHYLSQHLLHKVLVDMPVNVHWLSFDEVIERGVPGDATVLLLCGEPGTAWGGGRYWRNDALLTAVRDYVTGGGGLVTIGAPTLVDGELALGDLLGVAFAGYANDDCAAHLWNINRWSMAGRDPETFPHGGVMPLAKVFTNAHCMPAELLPHLETQYNFWTLRHGVHLRPAGAAIVAHEMAEDVGDGAP